MGLALASAFLCESDAAPDHVRTAFVIQANPHHAP